MRVLHVNKYFYLQGGAEKAFFQFDELLRGAGHETIHFAMAEPRNRPSPWSGYFVPEVRHDRSAWDPESWKAALRTLGAGVSAPLRRIVRDAQPEVAVIHNAYHQLGQPALMGTLAELGVPTVHVLHDYKPICGTHDLLRDGRPCFECAGGTFWHAAWHGCGGGRGHGLTLAIEAYVQRPHYLRLDIVTAPSRFLARKAHEMGFTRDIRLLRNPIDVRLPIERPDQGVAVGFAGRLAREKGLDVLLAAAQRLPHVAFRIAGSGPLGDAVAAARPANVTLLGQLSPAALETEMRTWRFSVVPTISFENCSYAVLEACAMGQPVIGTAVGGTPEILEGCGVLVPPSDADALTEAIGGLWDDAERLREMGAACHARVRGEFAPEPCLQVLEGLLREAIARHAPAPA
jgi:glycosyltransferase involved in cell wall biosynthesis